MDGAGKREEAICLLGKRSSLSPSLQVRSLRLRHSPDSQAVCNLAGESSGKYHHGVCDHLLPEW